MALRDNVIAAWIPRKSNAGQLYLDRSGYGTHLQWFAPAAQNWQGDQPGWTPRTTAVSDYLAASRAIPATVTAWSIVHWVKANSIVAFSNSMDANFPGNIGPRIELAGGATWVYSSGTGFTTISGGTTIANGIWACYCITHNGTVTARTYNQGKPTGATQVNNSGATGSFGGRFGAMNLGRGFSATRQFDGLIGGTVILGRQLSDAEIWQIYNAGPGCDWVMPKQRRTYGFAAAGFRAYWATQRTQLIGGGLR